MQANSKKSCCLWSLSIRHKGLPCLQAHCFSILNEHNGQALFKSEVTLFVVYGRTRSGEEKHVLVYPRETNHFHLTVKLQFHLSHRSRRVGFMLLSVIWSVTSMPLRSDQASGGQDEIRVFMKMSRELFVLLSHPQLPLNSSEIMLYDFGGDFSIERNLKLGNKKSGIAIPTT